MIGHGISHYKITEKLGEGGMGVVYKAEDTKLKRPVALKFLRPYALENEEHRERFLREAQAAASLDHPNICTVYEIDEAEGRTFLAMAYVAGQTVREKIRKRPLKLDEALDIAIQTAQGLQAAHENGVVHRDIKSANLMVKPRGQVVIMDFGLARLGDRTRLTQTGSSLGTPAYMSPEQALAERPIEARKVLDEMVELSRRRYVSEYDIAAACSGLPDERDRAFEFLEKALDDRCWGMALIRLEAMFDPLRSDPRFTRLLETMSPSR